MIISNITLTYTVSDGTVTVYTNGVANTTAQSSGSVLSDLADGTYNITIVAADEAGNIGIATIVFTIDTTTITTTIPPTTTTTPPTTTTTTPSIESTTTTKTIMTTTIPVTTPTATTKTTTQAISVTTAFTTSEAAQGSFPGVFTILLFFTTLVVVFRRTKKT